MKILLFLLLTGAVLLLLKRLTTNRAGPASKPPVPSSHMSREQARAILGLEQNEPSREEVINAHKRLMQRLHPDKGGSAHLAQQLNEAKRVLLAKSPR